jgi:predicted RND superfamily exporter protein
VNFTPSQPATDTTTATEIRLREPSPPETGCSGQPGPCCRTLVPWLVRRRGLVLWAALLVSLTAAFFGAKLYSDLRSGFEELLPDSAPSVVAARTLGPKLHNVTQLSIVFEGRDGDALDRLADDLAARLRELPPDLVRSVEYRTDSHEAFLHRFGGLYLTVPEIESIQARIDKRVAWEKRKANPLLNLVDEPEDIGPPPPLDFSDVARKYGSVSGALSQFRKGYFQAPDGKLLVVLVRPPESATGLERNKKILDAVRAQVEAVQPRRYDPSVRYGFGSEVAALVEEQSALVSDLASSTVIVLVCVLLALWIYFRRWTAILAISGALAAGCALTFGLSYFLVGYLNANTAFLGSIVVGNGINVSIIIVARFLEERRRQKPLLQSVQTAWSGTLAATFVASFGAGLAYLSLAVTDFRGFSQFGLIGGLGMALCWLTAYLLLPSLLAALDSRSKRALERGHRPVVGRWVSHLNARHGTAVRWTSIGLVVAALAGVLTYRGSLVEYDIGKLRAARSEKSGAQYWDRKLDQVFRTYLTPVVIRAETPAELDRVVEELERQRRQLGAADPLREVRTLNTAIPPNQVEKIPLLKKLRRTLTDARLEKLDPQMREQAMELRPPKDLRPVTLADLPATVRLPLTERDGTAGRVALAFPKKVGTLDQRDVTQITQLIRGAIAASGARAQAVSQSLLFADMAQAIIRDGPKATLLAFGLVIALVAVVFRRLRPSVLVIASLLLGVAWLIGAAAWARVRLNFLNFVVLPITFGIGVDYAVNIVQRWRLEGKGSLDRVLSETGGAVALCSLTTIIGYSSLLVADNQALRGFGLLASLGELACIAAALVALPAWLLRRRAGSPR